jgi:tRNA dimethylallyltransferase
MKPKVAIVLGPTGIGKSEVALDVAEAVGGEIINADSQQIYRYMDIGTAKPPQEIRRSVPHHLIDIVDPDEEFSAARFRELALKSAEEIWARAKRVILCGGTGLYIRAFTHGLFIGPASDPAIRERLEAEIEARSLTALYERLRDVDPEAVTRIHPHDRQRIIRALEVFELTGKKMSDWQMEHGFRESPFQTLKVGLERERAELYDLINRRCDEMMAKGLVEEVKALVGKGYTLDLRPLQSVGYRHIGLYLKREMSLEDAVSLMKRDSRRLAKRQLTWFRADKEILWFHPEKDRRKIIETAKEFFTNERETLTKEFTSK